MSHIHLTGPLTVFIIRDCSMAERSRIAAAAPDADIRYFANPTEAEAEIEQADVVAGTISAAAFRRATRLRWQHSWRAGPDRALSADMLASPVVLTSTKSNGAVPLAEHAVLLMLMLNCDMLGWQRAQADRRWDHRLHPELNGLTCGIIGLGHCGQDLALKAKAFHMRVIGMRRTDTPTPQVDALFPRDRLHEFLAQADFVVMTAPLTSMTAGLLGESEYRAMRPSAYYICVSRGGIADDAALLRALREGWIAGAGLDAHAVEPLPMASPFWALPNVIITPHVGANTLPSKERGLAIFINNLRRCVAGEPLVNVVDKLAGY